MRKFEIKNDKLVDRYDHESGEGCDVRFIPELSDRGREPLEPPRASNQVDPLLKRVEAGDGGAPMESLEFADDPRVLSALRKRMNSAPVEEYMNLAQALGLARDADAVQCLTDVLRRLSSNDEHHEEQERWNYHALSAVSVAEALLLIDPWHSDASSVLIDLLNHNDEIIRQNAADAAASVVSTGARTGPVLLLTKHVETALDDVDNRVFLNAAPAFIKSRWPEILDRAAPLARHDDWTIRLAAHAFLLNIQLPWGASAFDLLRQWLPHETSGRLRVILIAHLAPLVSSAERQEVISGLLADESPAIRFDTIHQVFPQVAAEEASLFAKAALANEPDPILRDWLLLYGE